MHWHRTDSKRWRHWLVPVFLPQLNKKSEEKCFIYTLYVFSTAQYISKQSRIFNSKYIQAMQSIWRSKSCQVEKKNQKSWEFIALWLTTGAVEEQEHPFCFSWLQSIHSSHVHNKLLGTRKVIICSLLTYFLCSSVVTNGSAAVVLEWWESLLFPLILKSLMLVEPQKCRTVNSWLYFKTLILNIQKKK